MVSHIQGLTLLWLLVHWNTLVSGNASSLNAVFTLPISRTFTTARLPSSYMASNLYRTGPRLKRENDLLELPILVKSDYQFSSYSLLYLTTEYIQDTRSFLWLQYICGTHHLQQHPKDKTLDCHTMSHNIWIHIYLLIPEDMEKWLSPFMQKVGSETRQIQSRF